MVFPMKFHFFNSFNHKASLILAYQIKILSEIGSKSKKVILKGHYRPYSEFGHCANLAPISKISIGKQENNFFLSEL